MKTILRFELAPPPILVIHTPMYVYMYMLYVEDLTILRIVVGSAESTANAGPHLNTLTDSSLLLMMM